MPDEAPLVELLRALADEIDNGGGSRPRTEYRNALRDARAVLNAAAKPTRGTRAAPTAPEPEVESSVEAESPPDNLLQFEQKHGLA
jgi:hypothetical protein